MNGKIIICKLFEMYKTKISNINSNLAHLMVRIGNNLKMTSIDKICGPESYPELLQEREGVTEQSNQSP